MKEELTTAMHAEFSVDDKTELRHKAGCVWGRKELSWDSPKEEVSKIANQYGIDYQTAMIYKSYWMKRIAKK